MGCLISENVLYFENKNLYLDFSRNGSYVKSDPVLNGQFLSPEHGGYIQV